jgi:hypothetical protein
LRIIGRKIFIGWWRNKPPDLDGLASDPARTWLSLPERLWRTYHPGEQRLIDEH